jgi:hypothetical protein
MVPKRAFFIVRNFSNTGRASDYPLLGAKRSRAEKELSRNSQEAVQSFPSLFTTARSYWFSTPLFARHDAESSSREEVPESTNAEIALSVSSKTALFVDEGEFLRLGYERAWIAVRSSKGLVYLQHLLLHPHEEVHVSHLSALVEQRSGLREAGFGVDVAHDLRKRSRGDSHSGDILDPRAKREYRARVVELRGELDEALRWADVERADSIRREIDAPPGNLSKRSTAGAGKMSDPIERVRKAVTHRIREAIQRIDKQHPDLGHHLQNAIHTGYYCGYSPERPVT